VIREVRPLEHYREEGQGLYSWSFLIYADRHGQVMALQFTDSVTSLLRNHLEKQANDLSQKSNAMIGNDIAENKSSLVIPIPAFPSRSKTIFIEARPIAVRARE